MLRLPPTFRLVSWPVRLLVFAIAVGAGWTVLETWAAGVRLSKMITAMAEREDAAEAARSPGKQEADGGVPGVIYILEQPHLTTQVPQARPPAK